MALVELITIKGFAGAVDSFQDLQGRIDSGASQVLVRSFYPGKNRGGGTFYYDSTRLKSAHDGGTIISPTVPFSTTLSDYISKVGETDPTGSGCWVRVIDGPVYPDWWGAIGDNSTPVAAAFQAALDYCSGKGLPGTGTGFNMKIRGGRYIIETGLNYTWRFDQGVIDDGDMRRLSITGDGTGNTYLIYTGSSTVPALYIRGGTGDGVYLRLHIQGFRLWRSLSLTRYLGIGIRINRGAKYTLEHVDLGIFNTGLYLEDTLYGCISECDLSGNNQGLQAQLTAFSQPNAVSVYRCNFGGCLVRGAYVINGANFEFDSCTFEGIGTDGTNEAILYQGGPQEGGQGLLLNNCYFENNYTQYDVNISNTLAHTGTHQILGCSFNRTSSTRYTTGGSINLFSSTAVMRPTIQGCAFKGFNSYVASAARPAYTIQSSTVLVTEVNNFYMYTLELPNTNSFPVQGFGIGSVAAAASVSSAGVVLQDYNVASVSSSGTGVWVVTFRKALRAAPTVVASIKNGVGFATATVTGTSSVTINTYNVSGTATNLNFDFVAMGVIA